MRIIMYIAKKNRYDNMKYLRCGKSGIFLPRVALGLWHNFGSVDCFENMREMLFTAFDKGITHFDLANNYYSVYGSAEENFGRIMESDLKPYRDEMILSTKRDLICGQVLWEFRVKKISDGKHRPKLKAYETGLCGYFLSS